MFQRTTLSFGEAKQKVCLRANKSATTEMLLRAGDSIQTAMTIWNGEALWPWLLSYTDLDVVGGSPVVTLPWDFKDIYGGKLVGQERQLYVVNRRMVNRYKAPTVQSSIPAALDLFETSYSGTLRLYDTPTSNDTLKLEYYRHLVIPCAVSITGCSWSSGTDTITLGSPAVGVRIGNKVSSSRTPNSATITEITGPTTLTVASQSTNTGSAATISCGSDTDFLDIPQQYESGLLDLATYHFLIAVGGPESKALAFLNSAQRVLENAKVAARPPADSDLAFMPPPTTDTGFWNPNATW